MTIEEKLKMLGYKLPPAPAKGGVYTSVKPMGKNLFYISGCGAYIDGTEKGGNWDKILPLKRDRKQRDVLC